MAWFKFGKHNESVQDARLSKRGGARLNAQAPAESVEAMRQKAKFRLIGSAVLVLAAVVGFPLLFDSQPRPVSVDIPIEIPDKAKAKPLTLPTNTPSRPAPAAVVEDKASLSGKEEIVAPGKGDKPADSAPAAPTAPVTAAATDDAAKAKAKAAADKLAADKLNADKLAADKARKAAEDDKAKEAKAKEAKAKEAKARAAEADKAKALLEGSASAEAKPAAAPTASESGRFIVQFGAFTDVAKSREVRQKVEKAGLKTYSQIAKNADGDLIRVRVGPYATRAEADKAAAKIKALGLPASILTL